MENLPDVGSAVQLNSGSPVMKVVHCCAECGIVEAIWFTNDGEVKHGYFPKACLRQ